jgi:hypothetical protein
MYSSKCGLDPQRYYIKIKLDQIILCKNYPVAKCVANILEGKRMKIDLVCIPLGAKLHPNDPLSTVCKSLQKWGIYSAITANRCETRNYISHSSNAFSQASGSFICWDCFLLFFSSKSQQFCCLLVYFV